MMAIFWATYRDKQSEYQLLDINCMLVCKNFRIDELYHVLYIYKENTEEYIQIAIISFSYFSLYGTHWIAMFSRKLFWLNFRCILSSSLNTIYSSFQKYISRLELMGYRLSSAQLGSPAHLFMFYPKHIKKKFSSERIADNLWFRNVVNFRNQTRLRSILISSSQL